jgi:hypothetical protein
MPDGSCVIVFTAGRCDVSGQARMVPSGQEHRASRGKPADDRQWYNPTLSCATRCFMLFRMSRIESGSARGPARKGNREGKKFFIWIRCNPLKRPDSTKGIQGNASLFPWFYLDLLWIYLAAKPNSGQRALSLSNLGAEPDDRVDRRLGLVELRRVAAGL